MFSHIYVGVTDLDRAWRFYREILPLLGLEERVVEPVKGWAGWQSPDHARPLFFIGRPLDGQAAHRGNGHTTAFLADRPTIDRIYATALANGGTSEGAPGPRPEYHPNYYATYFRDPDGNKLCVCCHDPA